MKYSKLFLALCGVVGMMFVTACNNAGTGKGTESDSEILSYNISQQIKRISSVYMCPDDTIFGADRKVYVQKNATIYWLTDMNGNTPIQLQDSVMSVAFDTVGVSIETAMGKFASKAGDFCVTPQDKIVPMREIPNDSNAVLFDVDVEAQIIELTEKLVVYRINFQSYTGGAHGNMSNEYINYDVQNGKVLSYDDIFVPGSDDEVYKILQEQLLSKYNVNSLVELATETGIFVNDLYLTREVYITPSGISFYYNPYDIGPWALGAITIHVYEYQLAPYLTPEVRNILQR